MKILVFKLYIFKNESTEVAAANLGENRDISLFETKYYRNNMKRSNGLAPLFILCYCYTKIQNAVIVAIYMFT